MTDNFPEQPDDRIPLHINRVTQIALLLYLFAAILILVLSVVHHISNSSLVPPTSQPSSSPSTVISLPPIPFNPHQNSGPALTAKAALVIDLPSSTILYSKNPDDQLLPASTTKIMTALVALDSYPLDQEIVITEEERTIGHTMKLTRGERMTVKNLLFGTLVASGNDAALALALSYPQGGYSAFLEAMNQKAKQLHMTNTSYRNVSGVESPNHYTSAKDLATLTQIALQNQLFSDIISTEKIAVTSVDKVFTHNLYTTNQLLGKIDGLDGVKTGWTENAGECLVTTTSRNGHRILTVILGSEDRFGESENLIEWAFSEHYWVNPDESTQSLFPFT